MSLLVCVCTEQTPLISHGFLCNFIPFVSHPIIFYLVTPFATTTRVIIVDLTDVSRQKSYSPQTMHSSHFQRFTEPSSFRHETRAVNWDSRKTVNMSLKHSGPWHWKGESPGCFVKRRRHLWGKELRGKRSILVLSLQLHSLTIRATTLQTPPWPTGYNNEDNNPALRKCTAQPHLGFWINNLTLVLGFPWASGHLSNGC